jgi:hypothetical protein
MMEVNDRSAARRPPGRAGGTTMDFNEYAIDTLVQEKLRDARAAATSRAVTRGARPGRPTLRVRVGAALIALGERLAAPVPQRPCATPSAGRG